VDNFLSSRYDFISHLDGQVSVNTSESLYDKDGTLTRAALLGISKSEIEELLSKNKLYITNLELFRDSSSVTNPIEEAKLLDFKDFYESLQKMEDPETPVSLRREISNRISRYKDSDAALFILEEGGTSKEIFDALKESEEWKEESRDYLSKDDVDLPRATQQARWEKFEETINYIKDLKHFN
jgi:hypothetical protein